MIQFLLPIFFLSLIGIFNIFGIQSSLAFNQIFSLIAGFIAYAVVRKLGRNFFSANSRVFYILFLILLVVTFIIGLEAKGSRRWIDLYFFNLQSSEIFKGFFILFFSDFLVKNYSIVNPVGIFFKSLILFLVPALIVFKQPDLGNASVYFVIFLFMILFSDLPKKYVLYFCLAIVLVLPVGWNFMKDYQKARILSFVNPHIDRQGTSYNMTQAIITVGSGKFLGRGLGSGTQSKLYFLPENHTDFAFSSMVEQFGFFIGAITLFLYALIAVFIIQKAILLANIRDTIDKKKFLYTVGFLTYFVFQILVNIGMNLGLFPIAGIALPFISYGGSAFVALMVGFALLP